MVRRNNNLIFQLAKTLLLVFLLMGPSLVVAQSDSTACQGAGCCCNPQAGGNWSDCVEGFECRRQVDPPFLQLCIKKGSPPQAPLALASSQPAECKKPAEAGSAEGSGCQGVGCCCNAQAGGKWPDCAQEFECRKQTDPPHLQVCVKKNAPPNTPLSLASTEPPNCFKSAATKAPPGLPGKGHPICEGQPNEEAKQWCYRHLKPPK